MRVLEEDLDGCRHRVLDNPAKSPQGMAVTIAADHYFMMGDNRDNSNDSRYWGTVSRADIKGPAMNNYWSWNNQLLVARDAQSGNLRESAARKDPVGPHRQNDR